MSPLADIDAEPDELPLEVEDFLVWLATERGRAANTLAAYRRDLRAYCRHLAECGSDVLTADSGMVDAHVRRLREAGSAPASVARAVAASRSARTTRPPASRGCGSRRASPGRCPRTRSPGSSNRPTIGRRSVDVTGQSSS